MILTVLYLQIFANLTNLASRNHRPPILWIQLDNPTGENKHKYLLAFASWLVHIGKYTNNKFCINNNIYLGWFKEVMISFLPPGHTHVDIDQMFSIFAIWLLQNSVYFITTFIKTIKNAYKAPDNRMYMLFFLQFYVFYFIYFLY